MVMPGYQKDWTSWLPFGGGGGGGGVHSLFQNVSRNVRPAVYINFVQIVLLTEPLCRAQAILYALPNNERGTKYRGLTYSARQNCP